MSVLIERQCEMPQRFARIPRLLQRTQHEIGQDSLFRLAGDFLGQPLIVLGPNLKIL